MNMSIKEKRSANFKITRVGNSMASRTRQKSAAIAAGTCCFRGRYPLNLQQVPAEFAAATCWICGGYLLISRQVPAGFAAGTC